jgi:hypothetical protein
LRKDTFKGPKDIRDIRKGKEILKFREIWIEVSLFFESLRESTFKGPKGIRDIRKRKKKILEKKRRDLKFSFLRIK